MGPGVFGTAKALVWTRVLCAGMVELEMFAHAAAGVIAEVGCGAADGGGLVVARRVVICCWLIDGWLGFGCGIRVGLRCFVWWSVRGDAPLDKVLVVYVTFRIRWWRRFGWCCRVWLRPAFVVPQAQVAAWVIG